MPDISTVVAGLKLKNPTMLASGIWGETASSLLKAAERGAAAVVTKSIGREPREGYPNPTVVELEYGLLNAMGLPNPGIEYFEKEMKEAVKKSRVPVIGSIFGKDAEEFSYLARKMEGYGADALELNLSCPHAKGYGSQLGENARKVFEITDAVKGSVKIPVFVKLTPNVTNIVEIAKAAENGGCDGIVAINTVKAMAINVHLQRPILSNRMGGYSGKAIKPIGVRCVYEICREVNRPVIGVGGINCGDDALEYIMAGAVAVQMGEAVQHDENVFRKVGNEIEKFLEEEGYTKLKDIIGIAQRA